MLSLKERLSELQNALAQHVHSAALGHHSTHFKSLFSFVALPPQLSGILWPIHGWFLFSISFVGSLWGVILCSLQGVIVLCYFSKISFLAIFLSTLWHGSGCLYSWLFLSIAAASLSLWSSQRKECRWGSRLSPSDSQARSQRSIWRAEWKERLQVCRQRPSEKWAHLRSPQKSEVWTVGTLEPKDCEGVKALSEWLKQIQPFV